MLLSSSTDLDTSFLKFSLIWHHSWFCSSLWPFLLNLLWVSFPFPTSWRLLFARISFLGFFFFHLTLWVILSTPKAAMTVNAKNSQIFTSGQDFSAEFQIHVYNFLLYIPIWMSLRPLKSNISSNYPTNPSQKPESHSKPPPHPTYS